MNTNWIPTRLINVDPSNASQQCLLQLSSDISPVSYMTLSHCWSESDGPRPPKLTNTNIDLMRNRIPTEDLPRTFKDAIYVARKLGVSHLWIDSLCIVQDSMEDSRQESRIMDQVYRFLACNIMAEAAIDCDGGLFFGRDPRRLGIFTFDEKQTSNLSHRSTVCVTQDYVNAKSDKRKGSPLYSHGWVCQERWLAPCQISFHSNQVFWECTNLKACEAFPAWEAKVDHVGNLPTQQRTSRLPPGLMWTTRNGLQANGKPTYRPETYRAPTWSWASVEGIIEMFPEVSPEEGRRVELCQVIEAKTTPLGEDATGQVGDGSIK